MRMLVNLVVRLGIIMATRGTIFAFIFLAIGSADILYSSLTNGNLIFLQFAIKQSETLKFVGNEV